MLEWLKDKTLGKLQHLLSEKIARTYQEVSDQRLKEMSKGLPDKLADIHKKLDILNSNNWANHHLYKKAMNNKKYQEAFQHFFYNFEINLKHLIMSEMVMVNLAKSLEDKKSDMFPIHSSAQICKVQETGDASELIKKFCTLHGNQVSKELWQINNQRNFVIHEMMKTKLTEKEIQIAFEGFFKKNRDAIVKVFNFLITYSHKDALKWSRKWKTL